MTTAAAQSTRHGHARSSTLPAWTVAAAAAVAVLARLPVIGRAPSPDEAGFLLVGAQWNGPGSSLYGSYWVDRPPLLVTIFRLASSWGGLPALRLIGCVAVLLIVLGTARIAQLLGDEAAGRWAAITAAALCLSPLLGGYAVNGELLAAPFVLGGILAVILALRAPDQHAAVRLALVAGALATCALMVKQNFADVLVFGAVAVSISWRRSDLPRKRLVTVTSYALVGAAAALLLTALWTVLHGTSVAGVFDAMYPFRIRAGQVMAASTRQHASSRLYGLVGVAMSSGLAILVVLAVIDALTRRRRSAFSWALLALLAFAGASAMVGGNYWRHYLIGLVVPVSVIAGLMAARGRLWVRWVIGYAVVSAVLAWSVSLTLPQGSAGQTVGQAIGGVAQPEDTVVNLYGHAEIVLTSGLGSPYPELWSLPTKTLDPSLAQLDAVLTGPKAPTWLVTGSTIRSWGLRTGSTAAVVARDYTEVTTICDRTIYLRDGVSRAAPTATTACRGGHVPLIPMKELQP